jgi:hypothetical protein
MKHDEMMKQTLFPMSVARTGRFSKAMMLPKIETLLLAIALIGSATPAWAQGGTVLAWGDNRAGQGTVPAGLNNVVQIAAGEWHNLALKADGTVMAWGYNAGVPSDLGKVVAIRAGGYHNFALREDGTLRVWGDNTHGQCNVPTGLNNVVGMSGGWQHSIALKADGTVVGWGRNSEGQATVPDGLNNVVAISSGEYHNLALKSDGTVIAWGWNGTGQTSVPAGLRDVVAISGGGLHSLALKSDGTVVAWGWNHFGQVTVPEGLRDVVAIAGGIEHSLALKSDGTVVGWGANTAWASNDPNCQFIGSPCPREYSGQIDIPAAARNVVAIAGGVFHSIALIGDNVPQAPSTPTLSVGAVTGTSVTLNWIDLANETGYRLEARVGASGNWTEIATPDANVTSYQHRVVSGETMFYRLRAFNDVGTSPFSAEVSATTSVPPPVAPTLVATVVSHSAVDLSWNDVANETGYRLEARVGASGDWAEIATPDANATSYQHTGLTAGTTMFYRLRAFNTAGTSPFSAEVSATTSVPAPVAPTLAATVLSHVAVDLSWNDVDHESGYSIERRTDSGQWVEIATPAANATSFNDAALAPATTYFYRIRALGTAGNSAFSAEVQALTQNPPISDNPLTFHVLGADSDGMRVRISGDSGQRFKVQRTTNFQDWTDVADSIVESPSTELSLSGEDTGGFFRTVNTR